MNRRMHRVSLYGVVRRPDTATSLAPWPWKLSHSRADRISKRYLFVYRFCIDQLFTSPMVQINTYTGAEHSWLVVWLFVGLLTEGMNESCVDEWMDSQKDLEEDLLDFSSIFEWFSWLSAGQKIWFRIHDSVPSHSSLGTDHWKVSIYVSNHRWLFTENVFVSQ